MEIMSLKLKKEFYGIRTGKRETMDEIEDKLPTFSTNDRNQVIPQTTFGLVTLNHFGISVRDLDRSIAFYRSLTGRTSGNRKLVVVQVGHAAGLGGSRSSRTAIRWATFRINNVNIDLLQVKEEEEPDLSLANAFRSANWAQCMPLSRFEIWNLYLNGCKMLASSFTDLFTAFLDDEDGAEEGIGTSFASFRWS